MTKEYDRWFQEFAFIYFSGLVTWPWLKAQGIAESGLRHDAVSPVGARGIMQIMPGTAKDIAKHFQVVPNLDDPKTSIMFGAHYLRKMWNIFGQEEGLERLRFAFGAYNAGAGNIIKAQGMASRKNVWESVSAMLPEVTGPANARQTTDYVRRIEGIRLSMIEV
ncbi:MAG: lytic transglycosylase domain-containing protein [Desulfobulbus sp.]|nr:MAG: lytic transglycosylase domain-containing protein [Desulfobulbus sp.]